MVKDRSTEKVQVELPKRARRRMTNSKYVRVPPVEVEIAQRQAESSRPLPNYWGPGIRSREQLLQLLIR
ncbi:hypothetical protein ScPMuIL_001475 [Solemya velum]